MKSVLDVEVSCFRSYSGVEPKSVDLLKWLKSGKHADKIKKIRTLENKVDRDLIKASLPAVTVSGIFYPSRKEGNLVKHSRLICIDIDLKGNEHIANFSALKEQLFRIENVAYAGLSASGKGFFLIIPIMYPKRHKEHFAAIREDFSNLGLAIDMAPRNVASLRGYSWDPDGLFRHNANRYSKWKKAKTDEKKESSIVRPFVASSGTGTKSRVEYYIRRIVDKRIDITGRYHFWFKLGCAFVNEFSEEGREYFHAISQFYPGYTLQEADKEFDKALKGKYQEVTIGTFIWGAKLYLGN